MQRGAQPNDGLNEGIVVEEEQLGRFNDHFEALELAANIDEDADAPMPAPAGVADASKPAADDAKAEEVVDEKQFGDLEVREDGAEPAIRQLRRQFGNNGRGGRFRKSDFMTATIRSAFGCRVTFAKRASASTRVRIQSGPQSPAKPTDRLY